MTFCYFIQVSAVVYDSLNPEVKAYGNLTITVERNDKRPKFDPVDYSTEILETTTIGTTVATVHAVDDNEVKLMKSIVYPN